MATSSNRENLHLAGLAHVCLFVANAIPLFTRCPTEAIIVYTAALSVYIGAWRSVKTGPPEESMSKKDAMKFPLIGSVSLVTLFLLFKFLPADAINFVMGIYFFFLGSIATSTTLIPLVRKYLPSSQGKIYGPFRPKLPESLVNLIPSEGIRTAIHEAEAEMEFSATIMDFVVSILCCGISMVYFATRHWFLNNLLGLSFAIEGVEFLNITSTQTGVLLLSGLFFYDIFWVFFTPVMVSVATSFDAPIKLMFPNPTSETTTSRPYAMLGLGDIVIPGLVISLVLRYDADHHRGKSIFFTSAMTGYVVGLVTTVAVMNIFKAAQPALLYIVPSVLIFVMVHAAIKGEFNKVIAARNLFR